MMIYHAKSESKQTLIYVVKQRGGRSLAVRRIRDMKVPDVVSSKQSALELCHEVVKSEKLRVAQHER